MRLISDILKAVFYDTKTGTFSNSKAWMHAGYAFMSYKFLHQTDPGWELYMVIGGVVASSHVAIFWLKRKYDEPIKDGTE